jgi:WD40 repeat protein
VLSVSFSPDGKTLASASADRTAKLWDAASGKVTATLRGHASRVSAAVFSPDGRTLATAGDDTIIRLWDVPAAGKPDQ